MEIPGPCCANTRNRDAEPMAAAESVMVDYQQRLQVLGDLRQRVAACNRG